MDSTGYQLLSEIVLPPGSTSTDLQTAIVNAVSGDTIILSDNMTFSGTVIIVDGKTIEIQSDSGNTWALTAAVSTHFRVNGNLILRNIVIDGDTTAGSIYVHTTGSLTMNTGTVVQNCKNSGITNMGTFIMNDGIIRNNTGSVEGYGGGVYNTAALTMNGGSITANTARNGGGINSSGNVTINNGIISNNRVTLYGGGITINATSSFRMNNGIINNNISDLSSAGIHVLGAFTMSGGNINNNHATTNGGGIYAAPNGVVTISNGIITKNTADNDGGGIYVNILGKADITGEAGEVSITQNTAGNNGGGIYVVDTTYASLTTSADTIFSCNIASAAHEPPGNAGTLYPNIRFAGTSVANHPMNNYDIYYTGGTLIELTFNVLYNANGGTGSYTGPDTEPGDSDTVLTLANTGISREGYTFTGWNTESDGSETEYEPADAIRLNCNTILYAQWAAEPANYNVTYNANGGTGSYVAVDIVEGTEYEVLTLAETGISRTGYTFTDWNTQLDGGGTKYAPGDTFIIGSNVTLYAQWAADPVYYSVTYNANGGTGSYVAADIAEGTEYKVLTLTESGISRPGYTFTDWNTQPDGGGTKYAPDDTFIIGSNVTLYAQWAAEPGYYNVTYNANGGTGSYVAADIAEGTEYKVLTLTETGISRPGYTFTGWNTQPDGGGTEYAPGDTFTIGSNVTLYAQWAAEPGYYSVTYNANGGTGSYIDAGIPEGTEYKVLTLAETGIIRPDYTLASWNTEQNGGGRAYASINSRIEYAPGDTFIIGSNVTLYAQWVAEPALYYITYNGNGGTGSYIDSKPAGTEYKVLSLAETGIIRPGYALASWNTEPNGSGIEYTPGDTLIIGSNVTLYVQWTPESPYHNVTYHANGGTGSYADLDIRHDTVYTVRSLAATGISRDGYTFTGWNTEPGGSGREYAPGETFIIGDNVNLYARWAAEPSYYNITYHANGGTGSYVNADIPEGTVYRVLTLAETGIFHPGYTFTRWNTAPDGSGREYTPGDTFIIGSNETLYAQWAAEPSYLTVIYDANGGTGSYTEPYIQHGTEYTVMSLAETGVCRKGYTFIGWNTEPDGSGRGYTPGDMFIIEGNTILFAQWKANDEPSRKEFCCKFCREFSQVCCNKCYRECFNICCSVCSGIYCNPCSKGFCKIFCKRFCEEFCRDCCNECHKKCYKVCYEICCKICCDICYRVYGK